MSDNKELEILGKFNPGDKGSIFGVDANDFMYTKTFYKLLLSDTSYFVCNTWTKQSKLNESSEEPMTFSLYENDKKVDPSKSKQVALNAQVSIRPFNILTTNYDNFELRQRVLDSCCSKKMTIYARQGIVNKTDYALKFGMPNQFSVKLNSHSNCLFNMLADAMLCFKMKGYGIFIILSIRMVKSF